MSPTAQLGHQLLDLLAEDQALLTQAQVQEQSLATALLSADVAALDAARKDLESLHQAWAAQHSKRDQVIRQLLELPQETEPQSVLPEQLVEALDGGLRARARAALAQVREGVDSWLRLQQQNAERIRGGLALLSRLQQPLAPQQARTYGPPGRPR